MAAAAAPTFNIWFVPIQDSFPAPHVMTAMKGTVFKTAVGDVQVVGFVTNSSFSGVCFCFNGIVVSDKTEERHLRKDSNVVLKFPKSELTSWEKDVDGCRMAMEFWGHDHNANCLTRMHTGAECHTMCREVWPTGVMRVFEVVNVEPEDVPSSLSSGGIVPSTDGLQFIVLEACLPTPPTPAGAHDAEPYDLYTLVSRGRGCSPRLIRYFGFQLFQVLNVFHQGAAHRDLKGDNILLSRGLTLKFGDFGALSVRSHGPMPQPPPTAADPTGAAMATAADPTGAGGGAERVDSGTSAGTPADWSLDQEPEFLTRSMTVTGGSTYYMPPEYFANENKKAALKTDKIDTFSAGVILFQLLLGAFPFGGIKYWDGYAKTWITDFNYLEYQKDIKLLDQDPDDPNPTHKKFWERCLIDRHFPAPSNPRTFYAGKTRRQEFIDQCAKFEPSCDAAPHPTNGKRFAEDAMDLFNKCVHINPDRRYTSQQALRHRVWDHLRREENADQVWNAVENWCANDLRLREQARMNGTAFQAAKPDASSLLSELIARTRPQQACWDTMDCGGAKCKCILRSLRYANALEQFRRDDAAP